MNKDELSSLIDDAIEDLKVVRLSIEHGTQFPQAEQFELREVCYEILLLKEVVKNQDAQQKLP